jgi:hypothetical protein
MGLNDLIKVNTIFKFFINFYSDKIINTVRNPLIFYKSKNKTLKKGI